ncbi:MAG: hypothetical protein WA960_04715 [Tunicatimonas sp.]
MKINGHDMDELLKRAENNQPMSLAEANCLCKAIYYSHRVGPAKRIEDFEVCTNFLFKELYLTYYDNLNGTKNAQDFRGRISFPKRQTDVSRLSEFHQEWHPNIEKLNHSESLMNIVAKEARGELKEIEKLYQKGMWGGNLYRAKVKSISLHSKWIYLYVKEIFEGIDDSFTIGFTDDTIEIDQNSMVHIMFRHYSESAKQFNTGKSFHFDQSINHRDLPNELKKILEAISDSGKYLNSQVNDINIHIPIEYRGHLYSIWVKKVKVYKKGVGEIVYNRLKTFYSLTDTVKRNEVISQYSKVPINTELTVFLKTSKT